MIYSNLTVVVSFLFVITRVSASFALAQSEKHSWISIVGYLLMFWLTVLLDRSFGVYTIGQYVFPILGVEYNHIVARIIMLVLSCWLLALPIVTYLILLFKKKTIRTSWTKTDLLGALLWKDEEAKTYSVILLTAVIAILIGLSMNARLCMLACLIAPMITYIALAKHYRMESKNWWMLLIAMLVFHQAQQFSGLIRLGMLITTLLQVGYLSYPFMKRTDHTLLSLLMTLYLGILLPSICIGYNQYACINYARKGYFTTLPYQGIFYVSDSTGEKVGLRDRYGLVLEPQYDRIVIKQSGSSFWTYFAELQRLGYIRNYDLVSDKFIGDSCAIDENLQSKVCHVINQTLEGLENADRCQIRIVDLTNHAEIANARASMYGNPFYDYRNQEFMPKDNMELESGTFSCDSMIISQFDKKQVMGYAKNVPNGSVPKYKMFVKLATTSKPDSLTLKKIADDVATSVIENEH